MILTERKTYTMTVTEVDQSPRSGLNKKDVIVEYTNLELLHAVLTCAMPSGRISAGYRGKRKSELLNRIAMVESALEVRGDQLVKSEQTMYLDVSERGAISHYLGMIYTKLIAKKLYGIDCTVHVNLIEQPGAAKFVRYNGAYRQDLIGYQFDTASWSILEPIGRSENSQAAFENGCRQAAMVTAVNLAEPVHRAACMTYYERGYLTAVLREPEEEGEFSIAFPEKQYFKAYYQPIGELFADECPGCMYGEAKPEYRLELSLPWFDGQHSGFRHLYLKAESGVMERMKTGLYPEIPEVLKKMEAFGNTKEQLSEAPSETSPESEMKQAEKADSLWYCGSDGIAVSADEKQ
ncbi:MAG: hypothetical protein MR332_10570 [Fusicatenibacter sp.]|nr:hypothetical protein [Fusicatenibacter sp.]